MAKVYEICEEMRRHVLIKADSREDAEEYYLNEMTEEDKAKLPIIYDGANVYEWGVDDKYDIDISKPLGVKVEEMVADAVRDIFISLQEEYGIKTGDIDPLDAFTLDARSEVLENVIVDILKKQMNHIQFHESEDY